MKYKMEFPGTRIVDESFEFICNTIIDILFPKGEISQREFWFDPKWHVAKNSFNDWLKESLHEDFYLLYMPMPTYLHKLFYVNKDDLSEFLNRHIIPDKERAIDIIVSSKDFTEFLVCNHDGEVYLKK